MNTAGWRKATQNIITDRHTRKFLIGALLAASFYFISAGINEIALSGYDHCVQQNERLFLAPDIEEVCRPEWQVLIMKASSRHLIGLFFPEAPSILAWFGTSLLYALFGGLLGQMTPKWGIITFFIVHLASVSLVASFLYISRYIA